MKCSKKEDEEAGIVTNFYAYEVLGHDGSKHIFGENLTNLFAIPIRTASPLTWLLCGGFVALLTSVVR